ncbi:VOC family protein [Belnapia moabensis]|uniref:VOC family protein n=1 Tax=Belnapia moabensis TaxID=365533 RepID=UPI0005BD25DF|nr:VOC family protein [Belnapia moabensis]
MTGYFAWHELMVPDPEAATRFYGTVTGWGTRDASTPDQPYTLLTAGDRPAAGLLPLKQADMAKGALPGWVGHILVDDVDATLARATALGGVVHVPPRSIGIGRFAVLGDPQGAVFAIFAGTLPEPQPIGTPGHVGWNELAAADWPAAFDFYATLFGWQRAEAVDIGPLGTYQTFRLGGPAIGGMFNKPDAIPRPFWCFYIAVGDIDAAAGRVREAGGQIVNGPMAVPGEAWVLQGFDPQGAFFALLGTRATP